MFPRRVVYQFWKLEPSGITRLWRLQSVDGTHDQAVGFLMEAANPKQRAQFLAVVSFAKLDLDSGRLLLPATRPDANHAATTLAEAIAWLETQRRALSAAGWLEAADPIGEADEPSDS